MACAQNEASLHLIKHGLVLVLVGDRGNFTYKKTRLGTAEIDRAVIYRLSHNTKSHTLLDFSPYGYDER